LKFSKNEGLTVTKFKLPQNRILAREKETSLDESREKNLNRTLGKTAVRNLMSGVLWGENSSKTKFEQALKNNFFHHPSSHNLIKI
jgi:hypothetical protein